MSAAETARADQLRAAIRESLATPCICGECPIDDQLRALLALPDAELLAALS